MGLSASHRYHPDPLLDDPPNAILFDQCERCEEHAEHLVTLDRDHLMRLVKVCGTGEFDHTPTENERKAEGRLYQALLLVEHLTGLPWKALVDADYMRFVAEDRERQKETVP